MRRSPADTAGCRRLARVAIESARQCSVPAGKSTDRHGQFAGCLGTRGSPWGRPSFNGPERRCGWLDRWLMGAGRRRREMREPGQEPGQRPADHRVITVVLFQQMADHRLRRFGLSIGAWADARAEDVRGRQDATRQGNFGREAAMRIARAVEPLVHLGKHVSDRQGEVDAADDSQRMVDMGAHQGHVGRGMALGLGQQRARQEDLAELAELGRVPERRALIDR
ncbi:MAG: hypothetical protein R3C69_09780 [Geminicoccaceae bacterium]